MSWKKLLEREKGGLVHLVGIGGAGMSAIATVLLQMGYRVEGSDIKESPNVRRLRSLGAVVGIGHRAENIGDAAVVVSSAAIGDDNPELREASRRGIPAASRAEMLAWIMDTRKGIAVAGTHGKTTTSSLVAQMLLSCDADPSFLIGGELNETGGNARYGQGRLLVAEADESDGSLLCLRPEVAVITNIDGDHLDYFGDVDRAADVFFEFLSLLPPGGFAVVCGDDPRSLDVGMRYRRAGGSVFFYGRRGENHYRLSDETCGPEGTRYTADYDGRRLATVVVGVPGEHNMYNSLAALAVGHQLGLPLDAAVEGIGRFRGVRRRFETVGIRRNIRVVDDYAHHPTEIRAVLEIARTISPSRVVVVFQPHRYSRTSLLAEDFGGCFENADLVVLTDIYAAGEEPIPGVTGRLIAESITKHSPLKKLEYVPNRMELAREVIPLLQEGDLVLTMGAGDITQCAGEILELLPD